MNPTITIAAAIATNIRQTISTIFDLSDTAGAPRVVGIGKVADISGIAAARSLLASTASGAPEHLVVISGVLGDLLGQRPHICLRLCCRDGDRLSKVHFEHLRQRVYYVADIAVDFTEVRLGELEGPVVLMVVASVGAGRHRQLRGVGGAFKMAVLAVCS
jgi:hypothetical protein